MVQQCLTSHSTHYRSFRGRFYGSDDPTNSVTALEDKSKNVKSQDPKYKTAREILMGVVGALLWCRQISLKEGGQQRRLEKSGQADDCFPCPVQRPIVCFVSTTTPRLRGRVSTYDRLIATNIDCTQQPAPSPLLLPPRNAIKVGLYVSHQARSQPSNNVHRVDFLRFWTSSGFKIVVHSGCREESSIFKIIMIDDVTLWSKLESTW